MKTAQDISPSAVVCLALGLLLANMLMPELEKFEYMTGWRPIQEATLVDLGAGRLLERLPDNLGSSAGDYAQDLQIEDIWTAQGNETAIQELRGAMQLSPAEKPALMSDASAFMMIAAFIVLGLAASYTDMIELSADDGESDVTIKNAKEAIVGNANWLRSLKYVALCISILGASATGLLLFNGSADLEDSSDELINLGNAYLASQTPALVPDSLVVLLVSAFAVLALFIMKADIREMEEELQKAPSREVVEAKEPSRLSHPQEALLLKIGALAVLASLGVALWHIGHVAPINFSEQMSIALKGMSQLLDGFQTALRDFVLELFLGVCTVLGLAVMRVDIREMVEQLRDESGPKMTTSSPSRLAAKAKAA